MKSLRFLCVLLIFSVLAGSVTPVLAQDYRFQVPEQAVVVTVNKDGTVSLDYTMTFVNDSGAHAVDIVDIGMPNDNYDLNSITAEINGVSIKKITRSDVVYPGISLYLQSNEIPAGGTGKVHAYIQKVSDVLYPGTQQESEDYASLLFSPNWYDPQYTYGNTNYQMTLLLPPGLKDGEARYYSPQNWPGVEKPESQIYDDGRIFYTWVSDQANLYTQYTFGASFPARLVEASSIVKEPYVPPSASTDTSGSSGSFSFDLSNLCPFVFCLGFTGFIALMIYSATVGAKKRKMQYLPPKISMEGHGIKRGLTAVEAAILMEQPVDKIFTMILFGLLKKGAARVTQQNPLKLEVEKTLPEGLYEYETDFLAAFNNTTPAENKKLLQTLMINLIRSIGEKMKGFSKRETVTFYEDITKRAWEQVEQANTPEVKGQIYDDVMDWTMLDKNYDERTQRTFNQPIFIPTPIWWGRYDPTFGHTVSSSPISTGSGSIPVSTPSIGGGKSVSMPNIPGSSFAASVVNSVSAFSAGVLGNVADFTNGVTKVTNPPPPPSTYRGGTSGGGGHSCACACACAGCACACAGGGR